MATARAQRRWRAKYKYLKSRLNVMVPRLVHKDLAGIAQNANLRGKGDAVGFAFLVTKVFIQSARSIIWKRENSWNS